MDLVNSQRDQPKCFVILLLIESRPVQFACMICSTISLSR